MFGDGIIDSGVTMRPAMLTVVAIAFLAPVEKIDNRRLPLLGSKGPDPEVSVLRMTPSPIPSPVLVNTPGAARRIGTDPREENPSALVTTTSAFPGNSVCGGTRKCTRSGATKKICAARPLTVTVVPPTFV